MGYRKEGPDAHMPTTSTNMQNKPPHGAPAVRPGELHLCPLPKQAATLSTSFSLPLYVKSLSRVQLCVTPWTISSQAPLAMGFPRQEYWSGLPFPPPGDLPHPGIKPRSAALQADSLSSEPPGKLLLTFYLDFTQIRVEEAKGTCGARYGEMHAMGPAFSMNLSKARSPQ